MATREEMIMEAYKRGILNPKQTEMVEELIKRKQLGGGRVPDPTGPWDVENLGPKPDQPLTVRQQAMDELAKDVGPLQAFVIGAGKGFYNIGRGLGLADEADPTEKEAMAALERKHPVAVPVGEAVGESAPLLPLAAIPGGGLVTGAGRSIIPALTSTAGRIGASGLIGGIEGGIIQRGKGEDVLAGAGIGASVGMGAEILFPIIGKLGRKVFQRITGRAPAGAMLDAAGRPTAELSSALESAGMTFDDLSQDAAELISKQTPGSDPTQVARGALFAEEGVPISKGELTKGSEQIATEQRLLGSTQDTAAEPFRQFKLKQSESIKGSLESNFNLSPDREETGALIHDALTGRKKLLRTQKNELYKEAADNAKDIGGLPIFTDDIKSAIPDADMFEDLAITAPGSIESLDKILVNLTQLGEVIKQAQLTLQ